MAAGDIVQAKALAGDGVTPGLTLDATPTEGNLLVLHRGAPGNVSSAFADWAELTEVIGGGGGNSRNSQLFWKLAGAGESATIVGSGPNSPWVVGVVEIEGPVASPLLAENAQANATDALTPAVTPGSGLRAIIVCGGFSRDALATWSDHTINASTTDVVERTDSAHATGLVSCTIYTQLVESTGAGTYEGNAVASSAPKGAGNIAIFEVAAAGGTPHSVTPSDTFGLTDTATVTWVANRIAADVLGLTDVFSRTIVAQRDVADTLGLIDELDRSITAVRDVADTFGLTDQASPALGGGGTAHEETPADTFGLTDDGEVTFDTGQSTNDVLGLTDQAVTSSDFSRGIADTFGLTDEATPTTGAGGTAHSRTPADTFGLADAASTSSATNRTIANTFGLTDAISRSSVVSHTVADTLGLTDAVVISGAGGHQRAPADTFGLTDVLTRQAGFSRAQADTFAFTDAVTQAATVTRALADTFGLTDVLTIVPDVVPGTAIVTDGDQWVATASGASQHEATVNDPGTYAALIG